MLEAGAIAIAVIVLAAVVFAPVLLRGAGPVTVFCPRWGTMVKMQGDVCRAAEDEGVVGSPWECERKCLMPREAEIRRKIL